MPSYSSPGEVVSSIACACYFYQLIFICFCFVFYLWGFYFSLIRAKNHALEVVRTRDWLPSSLQITYLTLMISSWTFLTHSLRFARTLFSRELRFFLFLGNWLRVKSFSCPFVPWLLCYFLLLPSHASALFHECYKSFYNAAKVICNILK